ncbi:hypothetical protein GTA08_BOTSDO06453 [Neofusicoccum parvum]|nr:hypothetical protein GTA08_BOTSDO06453 [Neofusicoccum parvum]
MSIRSKHQQTLRQQHICEFLGPKKCAHTRSLLSLPQEVRRRIYTYAGLLIGRAIELHWRDPLDAATSRSSFNDPAELDFAITRKLLLTSPEISAEVAGIFYSANRFVIQYKSLSALCNLRHHSTLALKHLTIHLNGFSCGLSMLDFFYRSSEKHNGPLRISSRTHRAIIEEWQLAATKHILARLTTPSQLHLHLIADTEDLETAKQIVKPFYHLPAAPLAACSIRLGLTGRPDLQRLADHAVLSATGAAIPTQPFRFLSLPHDLRLHILTYTDLITPFREVEWHPTASRTGTPAFYVRLRRSHHHPSPSAHAHGHRFHSCWLADGDRAPCLCRTHHAAASTSPRCRCWSPPRALFLTSTALRADAQATFFRRNRVVVLAGPLDAPPAPAPRLAAAVFLADVLAPQAALPHLRQLELVLPAPARAAAPHALADWRRAVDAAARDGALDLPALALRVGVAPGVPRWAWPGRGAYRAGESEAEWEEGLEAWGHVVAPLGAWGAKGLQAFSVDLGCVLDEMPVWREWWTRDREGAMVRRRGFEEGMERVVMGEGYDAMKAGKSQWVASRWSLACGEWARWL